MIKRIPVNKLIKIIERIKIINYQNNTISDNFVISIIQKMFRSKTQREEAFDKFINNQYMSRNFITSRVTMIPWRNHGNGDYHKVIKVDKNTHYHSACPCPKNNFIIKDLLNMVGIVECCEIGIGTEDYESLEQILTAYEITEMLEKN
jgi:hypothetical protein